MRLLSTNSGTGFLACHFDLRYAFVMRQAAFVRREDRPGGLSYLRSLVK